MASLNELMVRVRTTLPPSEFIEAVSVAFQDLLPTGNSWTDHPDFRAGNSFRIFHRALCWARDRGAKSALVIGCGRGFAGQPVEFARGIVQEVFSGDACSVMACNVTHAMLRDASDQRFRAVQLQEKKGHFDLVVSHSVLHYVPDLRSFFQFALPFLKFSGVLILAHEPNSRFWSNPECQAAVAALRVTKSRRGWTRRLRGIRGRLRFRRAPSIFDKLNSRLMEQGVSKNGLEENEIRRLVDVHRPEAKPGTFCIGLNGFDFAELPEKFMPQFKPLWVATSAHLGYTPSYALTEEWHSQEESLAAAHPMAGSIFTAAYGVGA